jgi:transcriptional regulator with XRE-family HTH domain
MSKQQWESTGFGQRLKAVRVAAGRSQQQLADAVGVTVMTISRLERGEHEPAWPLALAIAAALGVDCTSLAGPATASGRPEATAGGRKAAKPLGEKPAGKDRKRKGG